MASIKKIRNTYFSRVTWRDGFGKKKEKAISLKTKMKSEAVIRNNDVEKVEDLIREGENWSFPWMQDGGKKKLIRMSVEDAVEKFYNIKRLDNLKPRTFEAYSQGLNAIMKAVGRTTPIDMISYSDINIFKEWSKKRHQPRTTNLCLQKIKTFLGYCYDMEYIKRQIPIDMLRVSDKPPMYLTETELGRLFSTDMVDAHFKRAFYFYASTGCRLTEAFNGQIRGSWLIVDADDSKSGKERQIRLGQKTLPILVEMRNQVDNAVGKSGSGSMNHSRTWQIKRYSKEFKKVAVAEGFGEHYFHNLRNTYGVMRWAETGDIHLVSKELGHSSIKQTEAYTKFELSRIMDDFPTLAPKIQQRLHQGVVNNTLDALGSKHLFLS